MIGKQVYVSKCGKEIEIDYNRDELLTDYGKFILKDRYLLPDEKSPQEAFARASCAFADDANHAQRIYEYASKLWFMFSTPLLCNGGTTRGLPISCFLNYVDDSCEGLAETYKEDIFLSRMGGGIGTSFSAVRSVGEHTSSGNKTTGIMPFIKVKDSLMLAFQQGSNRRGSCAIYLDINHPEIDEFLEMRKQTGDEKRKSRYLHHGVNITDAFMEAVENGDKWKLVDPHSGSIKKVVDARELWKKVLITRVALGEPYLHFIDTSNKALPLPLKARGLRINSSNLCNEIYLPTNKDRTAVCCLSSTNLETYDEWKDEPLFIEDLVRMLDNVLDVFIKDAPPELWRAVNSAKSERSIGLGAMGFHSFLQARNLPFDSPVAASWNKRLFGHIWHSAKIASSKLAKERGQAPDMVGTGMRNAHLIAVAPNASSSLICGETSASIEPQPSNGYNKKTLTGTKTFKNKHLRKLLVELGKDNEETWYDIVTHGGSVQHLDFLEQSQKDVYKTAFELDQMWVIEHACIRQEFIDQGQSVNLFVSPTGKFSDLHKLHKRAWQGGLKGLYYCRSFATNRAETGGTSLLGNETKEPENEISVDNPVATVLKPIGTDEVTTEYKEEEEECLMCQG